jgi:hypothetical protein
MNHIYKTVLDKNTGEMKAVSEHASGYIHSSKSTKKQLKSNSSGSVLKSRLTSLVSAISLVIGTNLCVTAYADNTTYTYTYSGEKTDLVESASIPGNFNQLIGNGTTLGIFKADNESNILVDYAVNEEKDNIPKFILAGYADLTGQDQFYNPVTDPNGENLDHIILDGNKITIENSEVNGSIYAGLAHITEEITRNSTCDSLSSTCSSDSNDILSNKKSDGIS